MKLQDSDGSQSNPGADHAEHMIFCVNMQFSRMLIAGKTPSCVLEMTRSIDSREKIVEREKQPAATPVNNLISSIIFNDLILTSLNFSSSLQGY